MMGRRAELSTGRLLTRARHNPSYPVVGRGIWGTVDGRKVSFNGSGHDPGAVNARATALEWYIQTLQNAWVGAGYAHLQLAGLYWLSERVNYQNPDDPALIQQASSLAQQANLPLLWVPYYDAGGIDNWQDEGFTAAWLQSHYLQGKQPDMHRLANAISLAKDTGMGFEVEANWQTVSSAMYRSSYEAMLATLQRNGMAGDVSHAYYAGSKVFVTAAYATSAAEYGVYQKTYQFMQQ